MRKIYPKLLLPLLIVSIYGCTAPKTIPSAFWNEVEQTLEYDSDKPPEIIKWGDCIEGINWLNAENLKLKYKLYYAKKQIQILRDLQ